MFEEAKHKLHSGREDVGRILQDRVGNSLQGEIYEPLGKQLEVLHRASEQAQKSRQTVQQLLTTARAIVA